MPHNPFVNFNRAAEALGYPALLVVSMFCLTLVVGGVIVLAVTESSLTFALAMASLVVAICILGAAISATFDA